MVLYYSKATRRRRRRSGWAGRWGLCRLACTEAGSGCASALAARGRRRSRSGHDGRRAAAREHGPGTVVVPPGWAKTTATAAVRFAAGKTTAGIITPGVVKLAESVVSMMMRDALKTLAAGTMAMGLAIADVVELGAHASRAVVANDGWRSRNGSPGRFAAAPDRQPVRVRRCSEKNRMWSRQSRLVWVPQGEATGQRVMGRYRHRRTHRHDEPGDSCVAGSRGACRFASDQSGDEFLREFRPDRLDSVYAVSLQTRVLAAAGHTQDRPRIEHNVKWLELAQIKLRNGVKWPGEWSYDLGVNGPGGLGDNSNTFYALLGLHAATGGGIRTEPTSGRWRAGTGAALSGPTAGGATPRIGPRLRNRR